MPFSFAGQPLQRARITVPRHAVWEGEVSAAGQADLAVGSAVVLELGDLTLRGYVVAGGTFPGASESTYTVAGGNAGWTRTVAERSYAVDAGVRLASVAAQLAADAGERIDLGGMDRVLGDHWIRPAGPASVALSALFPLDSGGWRVDPDGFARPGPRPPAPVSASVQLVVEDFAAGRRWARISLPGDELSALLPGAIVTAENLAAPIVVNETTFRASRDAVSVEVLGEGGVVELLVALIQALTPSRIFGGVWTYQVADVDTGRPNLRALAQAAGLPAVLACGKVPGLPGALSTLAGGGAGALVLVGFRDGSPARPYVAGYLPGVLPLQVGLDAQNLVVLGNGADFAALAAKVDAGFAFFVSAAQGALNGIGFGATYKIAIAAGVPTVAASKVKIQ